MLITDYEEIKQLVRDKGHINMIHCGDLVGMSQELIYEDDIWYFRLTHFNVHIEKNNKELYHDIFYNKVDKRFSEYYKDGEGDIFKQEIKDIYDRKNNFSNFKMLAENLEELEKLYAIEKEKFKKD